MQKTFRVAIVGYVGAETPHDAAQSVLNELEIVQGRVSDRIFRVEVFDTESPCQSINQPLTAFIPTEVHDDHNDSTNTD